MRDFNFFVLVGGAFVLYGGWLLVSSGVMGCLTHYRDWKRTWVDWWLVRFGVLFVFVGMLVLYEFSGYGALGVPAFMPAAISVHMCCVKLYPQQIDRDTLTEQEPREDEDA